ncbi:MAG: endopeptidase La [Lachnospiraceae bacterium]|nr:endopeptidase La [Lachnospiraceae bacterium]
MAEKKRGRKADNKLAHVNTSELPVIVIRELTLFPGMSMQFDLEKKPSVQAVEAAMLKDQQVFLIDQVNGDDDATMENLASVGTVAEVQQVLKLHNGMMRIQVQGLHRGALQKLDKESSPYYTGDIVRSEETELTDAVKKEAARREMLNLFEQFSREFGTLDPRFIKFLKKIKPVGELADRISANLPMREEDKLKILQATDIRERYQMLLQMIAQEMEVAKARKELSEEVSRQVDQHQREYILREQMAFIQSELDESDGEPSEIEQYKKAAEALVASQEVKEKLAKEIRHMEQNGYGNPETATLRAYIETLLELPWDKKTESSEDVIDIAAAKEILERDHYGLKDVKERVLEYLAVRTLTKKGDSPILCLVGPPGTGKTSIARSVAEATGKPYVRICLGGVRDEAEIRGHRRTYVGAMPGRISAGLKQAQVKDPLMLLDEIDKMSQDYHGDTASAMLEVLDNEQNRNFRDHYVELPMDLSEILFIATANDESMIPRPLLDRMEVIEIAGYTANEKFHIAKEHLLKKVYEKNGITQRQLMVADSAIRQIIDCYCREAGVRQLERELDRLCRKAAVEILTRQSAQKQQKKGAKKTAKATSGGTIRVSERNLEKYLGKIKFPKEQLSGKNEIGIVRGLAWTSVGGDTLQIEVNIMPGKGELVLTGQLGDVMKESAVAGLSYVRSVAPKYHIDEEFFQKNDIHIHIPEGAVPKDGPSAGITMATAVLSAITRTKVRRDLAMTGEISLRGRVMPVGGLKEKILAAKTLGVKTVLVPDENKRDVEEIDHEITDGVEIVYVQKMEEVIKQAFLA